MKKRFHKLSAVLVLGLLLLGMSLACYVWVRNEQRQYKLNRDLIAALEKKDTTQARVLVEAGADPNTREIPAPAPSLPSLVKQLLHLSQPQVNTSSTAFLLASGVNFDSPQGNGVPTVYIFSPFDPHLTQAMLLHGANVYAKDINGSTALHTRVIWAIFSPTGEYNKDKEIIQQLLANGADPDEEDKPYKNSWGSTPLKSALNGGYSKFAPNPDLIALLRKYRKHP